MSSGAGSSGVRWCRRIIAIIGGGMFAATVGVMISPGTTATQRMPCLPYWVATLRVNPITAAFDVPYAERTTSACMPAPEAVLTITPPPRPSMCGSACFVQSM